MEMSLEECKNKCISRTVITATFPCYYFPSALSLLFSRRQAFPLSELPPTIGLLRWLQASCPQTQIQTCRQEGRDRHCKQTSCWQDVTQICLQGPLNCSLLTERGRANNQACHLSRHQKNIVYWVNANIPCWSSGANVISCQRYSGKSMLFSTWQRKGKVDPKFIKHIFLL